MTEQEKGTINEYGNDSKVKDSRSSEAKPTESAARPAPEQIKANNSDIETLKAMIKEDQELMIRIGALHVDMQELTNVVKVNRDKMENIAKATLIKSGIPENRTKDFIIDINTGEIKENS